MMIEPMKPVAPVRKTRMSQISLSPETTVGPCIILVK